MGNVGRLTVAVVGMVAGGRLHIVAQASANDPVLLLPEPDNPHDRYAVAVYTMPADLVTEPLVSSVQAQGPGTMGDRDRQTILDRQAGYVPAKVAATLELPPDGVVGWVSQVRHRPSEYISTPDGFAGRTAEPVVGFDVTAWLNRHA